MLGIGCGNDKSKEKFGEIIITDPDSIENSNLSR